MIVICRSNSFFATKAEVEESMPPLQTTNALVKSSDGTEAKCRGVNRLNFRPPSASMLNTELNANGEIEKPASKSLPKGAKKLFSDEKISQSLRTARYRV